MTAQESRQSIWQWLAIVLATAIMTLAGYVFGQDKNAEAMAAMDKRITVLEVQYENTSATLVSILKAQHEMNGMLNSLSIKQATVK